MNMRIDQQIPMLLVERQALNEAIIGEKNVYYCPSQSCLNFMDQYLILKNISFQGVPSHARDQGLVSF